MTTSAGEGGPLVGSRVGAVVGVGTGVGVGGKAWPAQPDKTRVNTVRKIKIGWVFIELPPFVKNIQKTRCGMAVGWTEWLLGGRITIPSYG